MIYDKIHRKMHFSILSDQSVIKLDSLISQTKYIFTGS